MNITVAALSIFLSATAPQLQGGAGAQYQSSNPAAEMFTRATQAEEQNRKLQGRVEELEFRNSQLEKENAELKKKAQTAQEEANSARAQATDKATLEATTSPYSTKPKVIIEDANKESARPVTLTTGDSPNKDFEQSFGFMTEGHVNEAKEGFEAFVKKYPSSSLSGEAYYWLGEIAYDSQDYNTAAINYLKGYREYPKGSKAPENILKLALTLQQLGKTSEACQNLARFNTEFKTAHPNLLAKAEGHRKTLKCQ